MDYCQNLNFEQNPDYEYLLNLLSSCKERNVIKTSILNHQSEIE